MPLPVAPLPPLRALLLQTLAWDLSSREIVSLRAPAGGGAAAGCYGTAAEAGQLTVSTTAAGALSVGPSSMLAVSTRGGSDATKEGSCNTCSCGGAALS
jgi:hypothetical protein